jgi:LysR family transcriptional regulator, carnitine catabolism transcriptional activator
MQFGVAKTAVKFDHQDMHCPSPWSERFKISAPQTCCIFTTKGTYNASLKTSIIVELNSMIDFTSRQLKAFLLVAQHRSFTRAAGALFITPSGLSLLIRELENQLGVRLFERTTRRVLLTEPGSKLLNAVEKNLHALEDAMSGAAKPAETEVSLSFGAPPSWSSGVLAQVIKEFRLRHRGLRLHLVDVDAANIQRMVEAGELDMGLGFFFKHLPGIRRIPLFRFSLMVIRPKIGNASARSSTNWSALKGERILALQPSLPIRQFVDRHLAKAGVVYEPTLVLNYLNTQIAMVEAGMGVAIVPSFALPECLKRKLVMSRLVNPVVPLDFLQIRRGGKKLAPIAEKFTSFLRSYIAAWAARSGIL